jgi:hypothetical protein
MAYSDKVIDHYENPRNVGSLDKNDPTVGTGMVGAPACGDVMKLQIKVDENGIIRENTMVDDKTVLIGKITFSKETPDIISDESIFAKKGQIGYVDKTYITENDEGRRIAKVRMREERSPSIGDKFASRAGQKGTIGTLISEENMPFTKDGIKPDLIINPHAIPSRMTLGQLIECIFCKLGCTKGFSIDSTAFLNKGPKHKEIGQLLNVYDYATGRTDQITLIYFYINNGSPFAPLPINNNDYLSSVYFNNKVYNTFIYPYVTVQSIAQPTTTQNIYTKYINVSNNINNIYYDNTDLCTYVDKLDYKYFENKVYTKTEKKLNLSINYSKNIKFYSEYVKANTDFSDKSETILISLNDINKISMKNLTNHYTLINTFMIKILSIFVYIYLFISLIYIYK